MEFKIPELASFIELFATQFEGASPDELSATTVFRDLGEWSSMQSLIVIAAFDEAYGVTLSAEELKKAVSIQDLFATVKGKMG